MINTLNLNWKGPVDLSKLDNEPYLTKWPDMNNNGIYVHCLGMTDNEFAIIYVGIAWENSILGRNRVRICDIKAGKEILIVTNRNELEIAYAPNYDDVNKVENFNKLVEDNLEMTKLFYSVPRIDEIYNNTTKRSALEQIEGAIQFSLIRKHKSRQYLLTGVSNYNLRNLVLVNEFQEYKFIGLDREIRTPVTI